MEVGYLANYQDSVPQIAGWFYNEWSYLYPERSMEDFERVVRERANRDRIPFALVAIESDLVIGTASLKMYDMDDRFDLAPWLAGLYVAKEWRCRGVGSILVKAVEEKAQHIGFSELFLYTPDSAHFYTRLGWRILELKAYNGTPVTLMGRTLAF
ncbi:MAG TPA: GNAT family N-acetyltransferase [Deltaproteobacteria bacterium]|jgi:N-acetylglutamate synthase-like GNAT family acetyltransferase|nr:GNAT family N-acetyltransferase [Deltaproteobacteria bacterium]HOI06688.1 GNAT family N-acetyltransferase [Deltaproteobacteria bacterium]